LSLLFLVITVQVKNFCYLVFYLHAKTLVHMNHAYFEFKQFLLIIKLRNFLFKLFVYK